MKSKPDEKVDMCYTERPSAVDQKEVDEIISRFVCVATNSRKLNSSPQIINLMLPNLAPRTHVSYDCPEGLVDTNMKGIEWPQNLPNNYLH